MDINVGFRLDGKTAIVTGGGRGIGRTLAMGLADAGADVALFARSKEEIEDAAKEIWEKTGKKVLPIVCDVTQKDSIHAAVDEVIENFKQVHILVNNAGGSFHENALELSEEEWDRGIALNLKSVFMMSQKVGINMVDNHFGRIINIASPASVSTLSNRITYGPAKAGVVQLTRQLAAEWARYGLTVNAISPGWMRTSTSKKRLDQGDFESTITQRIPVGRIGRLEELVAPLLFFCSEGASYVTGQHLFVDGGHTNFGA